MAVVPIGGLAPANPLSDTDSTFVSQVPGGGGVYDPLLRMPLAQLVQFIKTKGSSNPPLVVSGGGIQPITVDPGDRTILVNNLSGSSVTLRLTSGQASGNRLVIKDITGLTSQANVIIVSPVGSTIDGGAPVVLQAPYAALDLVWNGTAWGKVSQFTGGISPMSSTSYHFGNISAYPANGMVGLGGNAPGQGLGAVIVPSSTGRVLFMICGTFPPNNAGSNVSLQFGSGTPPALNAAQAGSQIAQVGAPSGIAAHPICLIGFASGLTLGVSYWFDLFFVLANNGYGVVSTYACTAIEI